MLLADTSVWIDFFNGADHPAVDALDRALVQDTVVMGDLILLEILQGFTRDRAFRQAKNQLGKLELYAMLGAAQALACANHYRSLRQRGITIRRTADTIIASFCIRHRLPLLFNDRDFLPFVEHLGLQAVPVEPPK